MDPLNILLEVTKLIIAIFLTIVFNYDYYVTLTVFLTLLLTLSLFLGLVYGTYSDKEEFTSGETLNLSTSLGLAFASFFVLIGATTPYIIPIVLLISSVLGLSYFPGV